MNYDDFKKSLNEGKKYFYLVINKKEFYQIADSIEDCLKSFKTVNDIIEISANDYERAVFGFVKPMKQDFYTLKSKSKAKTTSIPKTQWGVHIGHCCKKHGCKYGNTDCPVNLGIVKQQYPCEYDEFGDNCFKPKFSDLEIKSGYIFTQEELDAYTRDIINLTLKKENKPKGGYLFGYIPFEN